MTDHTGRRPRSQKLYAIRRNGLWYTGGGWTKDIGMAEIVSERRVESYITVEIGMDGCRKYEIRPVLNRR